MTGRAKAWALGVLLSLPLSAGAADECVPVMDEAGNLICMLGELPVAVPPQAENCPAEIDEKALGKKLLNTDSIGFFTKLKFKGEVDELIEKGKRAQAEGLTQEKVAELRREYDRLVDKLLKKIGDDDPELTEGIRCAREPLWRKVLAKA